MGHQKVMPNASQKHYFLTASFIMRRGPIWELHLKILISL